MTVINGKPVGRKREHTHRTLIVKTVSKEARAVTTVTVTPPLYKRVLSDFKQPSVDNVWFMFLRDVLPNLGISDERQTELASSAMLNQITLLVHEIFI